MTVLDAQELSNSITKQVIAVAPNAAPVAAFTATTTDLTVQVDASTSTDDVGVTEYRWIWGDGSAVENGVTQ